MNSKLAMMRPLFVLCKHQRSVLWKDIVHVGITSVWANTFVTHVTTISIGGEGNEVRGMNHGNPQCWEGGERCGYAC